MADEKRKFMAQKIPSSEILAVWRYAPDEWLDFVEFEQSARGREIGDILRDNLFWVSLVIALAMIFCGLPAGIPGMLAVGFAVAFLFFLGAFIHRVARNDQIATLKARPGEVWITLRGVSSNGLRFDWELEGDRSRLTSVTRRKTYTTRKELNYLEFKCLVKVRVNSADQFFEKQWRVPVPRNKEREADLVIQRLYEARAAAAGQTLSSNSGKPLGLSNQIAADEHDFTGSTTCLRCGASIEAVTHFEWKCQRK
jgi:hypothetical protein